MLKLIKVIHGNWPVPGNDVQMSLIICKGAAIEA